MVGGSPSARSQPASHLHKKVGRYLLGRTIGEGTYAKVKYGQHAETGAAVAVKVLDKEQLVRSGMVEQIKREITILKQIRHPHIVNLLEVMSSRDKIFMVMELVTGGELFDKIVAEGPMKEAVARRVFSQLLDAVGYCHQQGVYHRDLKPENVLLSSSGSIKLSDFGLGVLPHPSGMDGLLRTTCGTPNYVAPEVLAKKGYLGGPADIWSLGVVLYVILAGCLPFDEDDLVTLFHKISSASYEVPPWLTAEAVSLLAAMLTPDPQDRATINDIWGHPWMRTGLARRSGLTRHSAPGPAQLERPLGPGGAQAPEDAFGETVQPEAIQRAYQSDTMRRLQLSPGGSSLSRRVNAFELIKSGLDISALFEARDDVVTRRTRFSSRASPETIMDAMESAAVAVGGRVARQEGGRLRLYIPNPPRGTMQVLAELFEVLPGTHMVDLQKVQGNTVDFHHWYSQLTHALSSIITKKQPGAGELGVRAATARRREAAAAGGQLRTNAFELIARCINLGDIFEEEHATSRHVQFSSRRAPAEILSALEGAAADMGGTSVRKGEKRTLLTVPAPGGRSMKLLAHLFEVLTGIHVCQIEKVAGSSMDFMRCYAQLAGRLQPIMMKRNAFPTATHARQLLSATPSMDEAQARAIMELPVPPPCPPHPNPTPPAPTPIPSPTLHTGEQARAIMELPVPPSPSCGSEAGEGSSSGGSFALRLAAAGGLAGGLSAKTGSLSRASLGSVPEEGPEGQAERGVLPHPHPALLHGAYSDSLASSSSLAGSSPPLGGSPRGLAPLPPLVEGRSPSPVAGSQTAGGLGPASAAAAANEQQRQQQEQQLQIPGSSSEGGGG